MSEHDEIPHAEARAGLATAVSTAAGGHDPDRDTACDPVTDPERDPGQEG